MNSFNFFKSTIFVGLSCWITMIATNNMMDIGTNSYLLELMVSMQGLIDDPNFGNGLVSRAINVENFGTYCMYLVIVAQYITAGFLWRAAILYVACTLKDSDSQAACNAANVALTLFVCLWLWFLCGGLYFGYWLKFSGPQTVHFLLLIISILAFIMNNFQQPQNVKG